ncbi:MAG: carbohydrate ABC transporter permease [Hungatella sp.]|nr:carbohydrate ABC transporter permease [Hungatella sp.]
MSKKKYRDTGAEYTSRKPILYTKKDKTLYVLQTAGAILVTLIMVFPVYWMIVTSFKSGNVLLTKELNLLPDALNLDNYIEACTRVPLFRYILNTIAVTVIIMILKLTTGVLAAYGFARGRFWGRDVLFYVILGAMMVPHQVIFVPVYVLCSKLGWVDTFAGLVLPSAVAPHFIFMLRQSFKSVDDSYVEAGKIDGLGTLGAIIRIMVPMCKATLITASLNTFITSWNSYFWPKIITQSDKIRVISVGLVHLRESWNGVAMWQHTNVTMAGCVITMIPAVILFFVFQKYMLTGYSKMAMK